MIYICEKSVHNSHISAMMETFNLYIKFHKICFVPTSMVGCGHPLAEHDSWKLSPSVTTESPLSCVMEGGALCLGGRGGGRGRKKEVKGGGGKGRKEGRGGEGREGKGKEGEGRGGKGREGKGRREGGSKGGKERRGRGDWLARSSL